MSISNPRGYSHSDWSVLEREEGSNSVSLLWVYWVANDPMPHTPSLISHATSLFTLDVIDPADACRRNITLLYSRTVAVSCRSNLSQFGCWEKQFHLPVQKIVTSVLVLRTLSWVHLSQASFLCSLSKAGSTSRPSEGEYYSQRIIIKKKTKQNKKPPHLWLYLPISAELSHNKSKNVPWGCKPMLTSNLKKKCPCK